MASAFSNLVPEISDFVEKMREDQGLHECEVFGCGSEKEEGWLAWETCKKDPGHKDFIPVLDFSEHDLQIKCQEKSLIVDYIKIIAELTVRLSVSHVSASRPAGYVFARFRGLNINYTGTGWVFEVHPMDGPCPCCQRNGNILPEASWWKINIFTACHVIYDKQEAENTKVDFFYDDLKSQVKTLHGYNVEDTNEKDDVCLLQCATHDGELIKTLMASIERYDFYERLKWDVLNSVIGNFCAVVSHPHGQPKKVTVGSISSMSTLDSEKSSVTDFMSTYTAATCNGSSGAPVISTLSKVRRRIKAVWPGAGPHSMGHVDKRRILNQCVPGIVFVSTRLEKQLQEMGISMFDKGAEPTADKKPVVVASAGPQPSAVMNTPAKQADFMFLVIGNPGFFPISHEETSTTSEVISRVDIQENIMLTSNITEAIRKYTEKTLEANVFDAVSFRSSEPSLLWQIPTTVSLSEGVHHVFLLVLSPNLDKSEALYVLRTAEILDKVLGPDFLRHNCIAVTNGFQFESEKNLNPELTFENWCKGYSRQLNDIMEKCQYRALLLKDSVTISAEEFENLLQMVSEMRVEGSQHMDRGFLITQVRKRILARHNLDDDEYVRARIPQILLEK